jgi:hypothetical protein
MESAPSKSSGVDSIHPAVCYNTHITQYSVNTAKFFIINIY